MKKTSRRTVYLMLTMVMLADRPPNALAQEDTFIDELVDRSVQVPQATRRLPRPEVVFDTTPPVPLHLQNIAPLTLSVTIKSNGVETVRTIARTQNRVHIAIPASKVEWLFKRNTLDTNRATAYLVNHRDGAVIFHNDTALRDRNIAAGWIDVLTVGLSRKELASLTATGVSSQAFGLEFELYERDEGTEKESVLDKVWWNDEYGLPLRVFASEFGRSWQQELKSMTAGINEEVFDSPTARFPSYHATDFADWGEEFHDKHNSAVVE